MRKTFGAFSRGIIIAVFVCLLIVTGCGGLSGDPDEPLGPERFGFHVLPLAYAPVAGDPDAYTIEYPGRDDFERIKHMGDWVVSNPWKAWWDDRNVRPHIEEMAHWCEQYDLKLVFRLEDQSRYSNHPTALPSDDYWFEHEWTPYVVDMVRTNAGRVHAYQVWNEPWEPGRYMLGPTGGKITPEEYIAFLSRTYELIKTYDPEVEVWNAGITSITEDDYHKIAKRLLELGLERYTDRFNFHAYQRPGDFDFGSVKGFQNLVKVDEIGDESRSKWVITEINHIESGADAAAKFRAIHDIYEGVSAAAKTPEAVMAFCWQQDVFLPGWGIKDTDLETRILEAWGR